MSDLEERIRRIYEQTDDWGPETDKRVELEISRSLTPQERIRWLEEAQTFFARVHGLLPSKETKAPYATSGAEDEVDDG